MTRPRDARRAARAANRNRPLLVWRSEWEPTARQLAAAEALRDEYDLLCRGVPSDAEIYRVMVAAR